MFFRKNAIAHTGLELRAVIQDINHHKTDHLEPGRAQANCLTRSIRASLMVVALLCGAEILGIQLVSPAFAKSAKTAAAEAAAAAAAEAADAAEKDEVIRSSYNKRKASVVALLESGKKIDSKHHTSHAEFATAESMIQEAEALAAANKYAEGKTRLDRAYLLIKGTMRNMPSLKEAAGADANAAADAAAAMESKKQEYEKLASTSQALTNALKRDSEKAGVNNADVFAKVDSSSKEAERLAKLGKYDEAYQSLDLGYHVLTKAIIKLKGAQNPSGQAEIPPDTQADTSAAEAREYVARELETSKALVAMLKHLNEDKAAGKEKEIEAIKATAVEAGAAFGSGNVPLAKNLIQDANSRSKKAIAAMQSAQGKLPASAASEAAHHVNYEPDEGESAHDSYAKHKESVVVLLEAGRRFDSEHQTSHSEFTTAESMIKEADALAAANKFDKGNDQLDRTYTLLKNTMRKMLSPKDEVKENREASASAKPKKASR